MMIFVAGLLIGISGGLVLAAVFLCRAYETRERMVRAAFAKRCRDYREGRRPVVHQAEEAEPAGQGGW